MTTFRTVLLSTFFLVVLMVSFALVSNDKGVDYAAQAANLWNEQPAVEKEIACNIYRQIDADEKEDYILRMSYNNRSRSMELAKAKIEVLRRNCYT
jgi:hypothetical protein